MTLIGQKQPMEVFYKKDYLKNFTKFTGKHLCWNLFFKQICWSEACNKKETPIQVFFCGFCKTFKNIFLTEHLQKTASYWASYFCDDSVWSIALVGLKSEKSKKNFTKVESFLMKFFDINQTRESYRKLLNLKLFCDLFTLSLH